MHFSSSSVNESQHEGQGISSRNEQVHGVRRGQDEHRRPRFMLQFLPQTALLVSLGLISSQAKLNKLD